MSGKAVAVDVRIAALDGVRGVAILLVLGHQLMLDLTIESRLWKLVATALNSGWIGVQLFFVLSGFLITRILCATRNTQNYWSSFYMRRALRIFPLYYVMLVIAFFWMDHSVSLPSGVVVAPADRVWFWCYLPNWETLLDEGAGALGHCWSLAVEEQFYLLWPLVVRWLDDRRLARLCIGLALGALALRVGLVAVSTSPSIVYTNTFTRIDSLALGALVAVSERREAKVSWLHRLQRRWPALVLGVLVVAGLSGGFARINRVSLTLGHSILALAFAVVLVAIVEGQRTCSKSWCLAALRNQVLRLLGKHSYAMYLLHLPLHIWVRWTWLDDVLLRMSPERAILVQIVYWLVGPVALLGIARVIFHVIEHPILKHKRRFAAL